MKCKAGSEGDDERVIKYPRTEISVEGGDKMVDVETAKILGSLM